MPIYAGQTLTAGVLNRLQPKTYRAKQSSALVGVQSAVDIPGLSVAFTTETAGAKAVAVWFVDARNTGSGGGTTISVNALLDGSTGSDTYAVWRGSAASEQGHVAASMDFTVSAAGAHTIKCQVTQSTNNQTQIYSSLLVTIYEMI